MNHIYLIAIVLLLVYFSLIFALNRIPNVRITSIGWFKLYNVVIQLPNGKLHISSINFRPFLSTRNLKEGKWLSIEFKRVSISLENSSKRAIKEDSTKAKKNLPTTFSVKLPKFVFEYNLIKMLVNLLNIQISGLRISDEKFSKENLYFDLIKTENVYSNLNQIQLSLIAINCNIENTGALGEQKKLFKNLELNINFELIESCLSDKKHVSLDICNVETSLRLGKLDISYEILSIFKHKHKEKPKTITNNERKPIDLEPIAKYFTKFDINVEELSISYKELVFSVLNTSFILQQDESLKSRPCDLQLSVHLTLMKLSHKESNCLNISSSNFSTNFNMNNIIKITQKDNLIDSAFFDWNSLLEISNTNVTIYYDQLDSLLNLSKDKKHKDQNVDNNSKNVDHKKGQLFERLRKVVSKIVVFHTKINLIMPKGFIDGSNFHRGSKSNELVTLDIEGILHDISAKNFKKQYLSGSCSNLAFSTIFRLKGVKLNVVDNIGHITKVNALCSYKINENKLSIKYISKKIELKSINAAFFYMIRAFLDRKKISEKMENTEVKSDTLEVENKNINLELFKIIPPFINSITFKISSIEADIICNENLPSYIIYSEKLGSNIDLSKFKRGISLRISEISLLYKYTKKEILGSIKLIQCYTMSECSCDFFEVDNLTNFHDNDSDTDLSDISSISSIESEEVKVHDSQKIKEVLSLCEIELKNSNNNVNELLLRIPQINGKVDTFLVWCTIYAETLINYMAPKSKVSPQVTKPHSNHKKLLFNLEINTLATIINLPKKTNVLLEVENLRLSDCFSAKVVKVDYARLLGVHPSTKLWTILLTICKPVIKFTKIKETKELFFEIISEAIKFTVPYQFLYYTVIDNFVTFFKAIRQIKYNFKNLNSEITDFQRIMPDAKPAIEFPLIRLHSKRLGVLIEDDPFEKELGYIFELGLVEQKERMKKYKLFNKQVESIRLRTDKSIESKIELTNTTVDYSEGFKFKTHTTMQQLRSETTNSSLLDRIFSNLKDVKHEKLEEDDRQYTEEEAQNEINRVRERLEEEISISWIKKYQKFKEVKNKYWKDKNNEFWGMDIIDPIIKKNYKIMNYPTGPKLMKIIMKGIDLTLDRARIPDIDQFLYKHGKGQPKLIYTILIPLYIQLKCRLFYIFLKDYPLPVLSFPENSTPIESFSLSGNLVINEKLVTRKEEMRFIYVPFSYADTPQGLDEADSFYSVYIPRTLTPVKIMMDLECNIDTERTSMATWCKSYSSGLSASGTAVDNFTKPQIDDSPIGWWDKIALLVHGRIIFNIKNEFSLHMKGSTSPYEIAGSAAGFVFLWKDNIKIRINDSDKTEEFIQIDSDSFILGIPDYSPESQRAWSFANYNLGDSKIDSVDGAIKKFQKSVIRLSSDEKVRWVCGVEFERNKNNSNVFNDNEERTSKFKPHYDVIVTNPKFPWHPDSYENYRSDYLHFALSVISKSSKNNSSNIVYLTPLTFHYFFHWWYLLTDYTSMPVRRGNLFNPNQIQTSNHVKMGSHLFTIKYQIIFEPLTISHTYLNYSNDSEGSKMKIKFTGLKGKVAKCSIDLHQRKEWIRFVNKTLGIDNRILHLKMNKGEVNIEDAEIRFLNSIFDDQSIRGYLVSLFEGENESQNNPTYTSMSYDNWIKTVKGSDALSWLDSNDFTELEFSEELSPYPKVEILPFIKIPNISYYRDFSCQKDGKYPFGNEPCHNCIIDFKKPEDIQIELIDRRIEMLENKIEKSKSSNKDQISTEDNTDELREKLSIMKIIKAGFKRESYTCDSSFADSNCDNTSTHELSKYSSRKSYYDLKQFTNSCSSTENCRNRFIFHDMKIVWNDLLRDLFLDYSSKISERKTEVYFMSKKALDYIEAMANNERNVNSNDNVNSKEFKSGEEVINSFHEEINNTSSEELEIENNYLIKLIHPQVQLTSSKAVNSSVLITSRELELKISSVTPKENDGIIGDDVVPDVTETRYGVLFQDSRMFVLDADGDKLTRKPNYSEKELLQWADTEVIYEGSWMQNHLVLERNSMAIIYKKPNYLSSEKNKSQHNDITVHLAKIVINATSDQYSTIYYIITDLLLHAKPPRDEFLNRLDNLILLSNLDDFKNITDIIKELQFSIRELHGVIIKLSDEFRRKNHEIVLALEIELERRKLELNILMKGYGLICSSCKSNKRNSKNWNILIDQVIWHLLDNERKPFIDFAIGNAKFSKMESFDGSNVNYIKVSMIQGFNLQSNPIYPELLIPQEDAEKSNIPIIQADWKMLPPIGGIVIMQYANLNFQPIKVELNYTTAKKLIKYLFPDDESEYSESEEDSANASDVITSDNVSIATTLTSTKKSKIPSPVKNILRKYKKFSKEIDNESDDSSMKESISKSGSISNSASSKPSTEDSHYSLSNNGVNSMSLKEKRSLSKLDVDDDVTLILNRSSKYVSILDVNISQMKIVVSFKGPKHLQVLNVNKLLLTIPTLNYKNKIWSGEDFVNKIKKDIIKAILSHTGKILGNKFKVGKRNHINEPLKQISDYASYVTLQDLQSGGQPRNEESKKHNYTKQYKLLQQEQYKKKHHKSPNETTLHSEDIYEYLKDSDDETD